MIISQPVAWQLLKNSLPLSVILHSAGDSVFIITKWRIYYLCRQVCN